MKSSKVELLAPAGDFECFKAAISAGADAVYLGGEKFGARAYANNFTEDEIIEALRIAHLFGRKVYLTVNTLVKEKEFADLIPYITPLYNAGLDGAIIQDLGVLEALRDNFPDLELHASTQMTVTGAYGAKFLKDLGVCRVVPARELSLDEIKDIKKETGLEIESFIHGAMCYGYSGQCLFSSILGGRSGNRGRCAGPCRLPYTDEKGNTVYPFSLKDMYTLSIVPKLIEAGVNSFKIEGRMKSPEYVAGVTAMYRKYIDKYLLNPSKPYKVSADDENIIRNLYIRTDICSGYYEKHNSKSMVTLTEPGYSGNSKEVLEDIRQKYILSKPAINVSGYIRIYADEKALFTLSTNEHSVTVEGNMVSKAMNRPLDETEIKNRISKMGDTYFELENIEIDTDNQSFMPVKSLNELRRQACDALEKIILSGAIEARNSKATAINISVKSDINRDVNAELSVSVITYEQLCKVAEYDEIKYVYVNGDLYLDDKLYSQTVKIMNTCRNKHFVLVLPAILRKRSYGYMNIYRNVLEHENIKGVLVRNLEELQWLREIDYKGEMIADYSVYTWNVKASNFVMKYFDRVTVPVELNRKEVMELKHENEKEILLYGKLPLMYSANCVKNTLEKCINDKSGKQNLYRMTDRYKNVFSIMQNCYHCYNVLYNTVPLSLHNHIEKLKLSNYNMYRIELTTENVQIVQNILDYYINSFLYNKEIEFPLKDFTNGHYKRGAE